MTTDVLVRSWKQPELRTASGSLTLDHPAGLGLGELAREDLRTNVKPFQAASSGWVCTVTDECPNSVFVCC